MASADAGSRWCRWLSALLLSAALSATISADATAQGPPGQSVSVSRLADLGFGTVIAGLSATVSPLDPAAAKFEITGPVNRTVTISFTLPPNLSGGAATMPIVFGPGSGAWAESNRLNVVTYFDPTQGTTARPSPPNRRITVWLGGQISPGSGQPAGSYTGVVTLSAAIN